MAADISVDDRAEIGFRLSAEHLCAELRNDGFDLRRSAFVTYLIEAAASRDAAYAIQHRGLADGWQASLYGDRSGWVVRLTRTTLLRPRLLLGQYRYVDRLAREHGGNVRGLAVENLSQHDSWDDLAARVYGASGTTGVDRPHAAVRGTGSHQLRPRPVRHSA